MKYSTKVMWHCGDNLKRQSLNAWQPNGTIGAVNLLSASTLWGAMPQKYSSLGQRQNSSPSQPRGVPWNMLLLLLLDSQIFVWALRVTPFLHWYWCHHYNRSGVTAQEGSMGSLEQVIFFSFCSFYAGDTLLNPHPHCNRFTHMGL
jgi:hypothetical protein